jgi:hypothetical protein
MKTRLSFEVRIPDFIYWRPVRWAISFLYRMKWNKKRGLRFDFSLIKDFEDLFFFGSATSSVVDALSKHNPIFDKGNWEPV